MSLEGQVSEGDARRDTGLVLFAGTGAAHLDRLRRAEASRLLKLLAATGERTIAVVLRDLFRRDAALATDVILAPHVSVLARTERFGAATDGWALELARRGLLPTHFPVAGRSLASPALGVVLDWGDDVRVTIDRDVLEIEGQGRRSAKVPLADLASLDDDRVAVERAYRPLAAGTTLALRDTNPLSMLEAHPDKSGNACSLGDRPVEQWTASLDEAYTMISAHLPVIVDELRALQTLHVPVGYEPVKHLSASYREYVGASYLTLHPDAHTMAEAIVHEHQHDKANLASYHDGLLENALGTMVKSPVRPDLRPIWGVLLAVHAFVPVAELYARMMAAGDARVRDRFADVIGRNDEGLKTVRAHGVPTRIGAAMIEELSALHARHLALVPPKANVEWEA